MHIHLHPPHDIVSAMTEMLSRFEALCEDKSTLRRLIDMAGNRGRWRGGHTLFQEIRRKTLKAERKGDALAIAQYGFEEVCAKTLCNLSREPAPFDPDAPFWIVPRAIALGRHLGLSRPTQVSSLLEM